MTIQLPQSAQPGVGPTESAKPDGVGLAALVGAAPARTSRCAELRTSAHAVGTTEVRASPTGALALVYSSTTALALAAPVSENPREHPSEVPDVGEIGSRPGLSDAAFEPGTGPRWGHH
jgi:hypothetical protein